MFRIRAALAVVQAGRLLLVPHYRTAHAPAVQWNIPGGAVEFGEPIQHAAQREFKEETGLDAAVQDVLDVTEVILHAEPYHSITITYWGEITGGTLRAEAHRRFGQKQPRWFTWPEIEGLPYHPPQTVQKALGILPTQPSTHPPH